MSKSFIYGFESQFGPLTLEASEKGLKSIQFKRSLKKDVNEHILKAKEELLSYFEGEIQTFNVKLDIEGTTFQKKCWSFLRKISYGQTVSYKEEALKIGGANYSRAVAGANNKNKLPIIIPCHRVIGSDGSLVGYAGGIKLKKQLLDLESKFKA